jgi:ribose transport system substrate-binding protein
MSWRLPDCDGKANPASMASCIEQGVDAGAGAIVTGSIDEVLVTNAYRSAEKAGIPVVNLMTVPGGKADPTKVAYLTPDFIKHQALAADGVIADSDATANVLVVQVPDTPATSIWMEQGGLAEYEKACPDCTVTVVKANTGQLDKLGGLITSAVTKSPDIDYVQTEFDCAVQPTVQGLQGANAGAVKISSHDGTLAVMQMLKSGKFVGGRQAVARSTRVPRTSTSRGTPSSEGSCDRSPSTTRTSAAHPSASLPVSPASPHASAATDVAAASASSAR